MHCPPPRVPRPGLPLRPRACTFACVAMVLHPLRWAARRLPATAAASRSSAAACPKGVVVVHTLCALHVYVCVCLCASLSLAAEPLKPSPSRAECVLYAPFFTYTTAAGGGKADRQHDADDDYGVSFHVSVCVLFLIAPTTRCAASLQPAAVVAGWQMAGRASNYMYDEVYVLMVTRRQWGHLAACCLVLDE